jgi:predicted nucleotidyltransferase
MDYDGMQKTAAITKAVKKYGNSGGVYLPSSWIGGEVEVRLIRKPANPEADILSALSGSMQHVVSVILYGSHARGEQAEGSDVDVLVVTDGSVKGELKLSEDLKGSRYDLTVMDRGRVEKALEKDMLFRKSLQNSHAIFNESFLKYIMIENRENKENYSANLRKRIGLAKSSLGIVRSILDAQGPDENLVYPLVMRIKEMLLIRCASGNVEYSSRMLKDAVTGRGITDGDFSIIMEQYRDARDGRPLGKARIGKDVFEKLISLLEELIADAEQKQ